MSAPYHEILDRGEAEDRTTFIGGSDIAAIIGVDPYKTRLQVWEEKTGAATAFEGNFHTRRGNRQEAVAADVFTERTGRKLQRVNRRIVHPVYPWLTARVDRRVVGENRVGEIKVPSLGGFSKIKRQGLHEGYIVQLQHYIGIGEYEGGEWIIFCPDQDDLITFPVEGDRQFYRDVTERVAAFWNENVLRRIPPTETDTDKERLEIQKIEGDVPQYDVKDDSDFIVAMGLLREARALAAETELLGEEARAKVKALVGDRVGAFNGPDFRLSYTMAKGRASFDKKALAGAKPLDRLAVGAILNAYWETLRDQPSQVQYRFEQAVIQEVGKANLDLAAFDAKGAPYPIMRPTFYGGEE